MFIHSFLDQNSPIFLDLLPSLLKILLLELAVSWLLWHPVDDVHTTDMVDLIQKNWDFYISSPKNIKFFCELWWLKCQKSSYTLGFTVYDWCKMESHLCSLLLSKIADRTELQGTHNIEPCIVQKLVQIRTIHSFYLNFWPYQNLWTALEKKWAWLKNVVSC
jgi:hypothetical protein